MKSSKVAARAWGPVVALVWLGSIAPGCKASAQAEAKVGGASSPEEIKDFDRPLDSEASAAAADDAEAQEDYPLLGARHDLAYAGPTTPTCRCLAARVEDRSDAPSLRWEIAAPPIDRRTQWVVVLSSQGVPCEGAPANSLGASYQGYETDGDDVIVFVEALGEGRPMTQGAIIPRPPRDGAVYIEASGSVYGKPLQSDQKRCKLPSPGAAPS